MTNTNNLKAEIVAALNKAGISPTEEVGRCLKELGTSILEKAFDQKTQNLLSVRVAKRDLGSLPLPIN